VQQTCFASNKIVSREVGIGGYTDGVEKRNVNLRLPAGLLRKFRVMAGKRNLSMSHLAESAISKMILDADDYDARAKRAIERMRNATDRGTGGKITWTREELHERGR